MCEFILFGFIPILVSLLLVIVGILQLITCSRKDVSSPSSDVRLIYVCRLDLLNIKGHRGRLCSLCVQKEFNAVCLRGD